MDTERITKHISIAFINDKSPIIDAISKDLLTSGFDIFFLSENIEDGIVQLSELKALPQVCIIDLDFYDKNVLAQLHGLKTQYPSIKLIAHCDTDDEKIVKALLEIGCVGYLLVGSDVDDFRKAIGSVSNG
ncbi:histidine kinase [Sphingobacterium sp. ML3W]|uniref:response regulator transcription factor n=1 Tax=Sphingobacterium sp. ML3W TaxID=1538644 RepID=UPI0004F5D840|nr:response regulator transcription factor [Sphingobacterium sp. ML3W]AIM38409.1 histidine kinase [Sphingobacterium sp. ML3W]